MIVKWWYLLRCKILMRKLWALHHKCYIKVGEHGNIDYKSKVQLKKWIAEIKQLDFEYRNKKEYGKRC